jgi:hypothetical protein
MSLAVASWKEIRETCRINRYMYAPPRMIFHVSDEATALPMRSGRPSDARLDNEDGTIDLQCG